MMAITVRACFVCVRRRGLNDRTPFRSTGPGIVFADVPPALGPSTFDQSLVATATAELASRAPPPTVKDHCLGVRAGLSHEFDPLVSCARKGRVQKRREATHDVTEVDAGPF